MGWAQVTKPMALTPFVMLSFQCFVASSLAQSMPHSCSFKDPMCFPFSISGYMPATKIKSLHSTACILSDSMSLLSKFVPYGDRNFKDRCGIKLKIIKKNKSSEHWWPRAFHSCPPCLVISYTQIPRGPSHHKSGSLNNKYGYHSTSQSTAENHLPMYEPLPSPRQSHSRNDSENPSGATAVFAGRVHRGPRRDQLLDHGDVAVPSRPMQRRLASGAEDATRTAGLLQLPSRNKAYSHGMFLQVVGKNSEYRS